MNSVLKFLRNPGVQAVNFYILSFILWSTAVDKFQTEKGTSSFRMKFFHFMALVMFCFATISAWFSASNTYKLN